jgi:hypothetical protein
MNTSCILFLYDVVLFWRNWVVLGTLLCLIFKINTLRVASPRSTFLVFTTMRSFGEMAILTSGMRIQKNLHCKFQEQFLFVLGGCICEL